MPTAVDLEFRGEPWLTAEKIKNFKSWYAAALESLEFANLEDEPLDVEFIYYDQGYADAMKHVLMEIHGDTYADALRQVQPPLVVNEIVEDVVERGSVARPFLIVTAVGVTYLLYKNRKKFKAAVNYSKASREEYNKRGREGLLQKTIDDLKTQNLKLKNENPEWFPPRV